MKLSEAFAKNYNALMKVGRHQSMQVCGMEHPDKGLFCTSRVMHSGLHIAQDHTGFTIAAWLGGVSQPLPTELRGEG